MPATPDWVWQMHQEFFRFGIPFTFGRPMTRHEVPDLHLATCAAVQFPASQTQFLLTAQHVLEPALAAVAAGADCLVGNVKVPLAPEIANLGAPEPDIATITVSALIIAALEADGYLVFRPPEWPPPPLEMADPILTAGFPSAGRKQVSRAELELAGTTRLGLIHHLRDTEFVCQLDPAFVDSYTADHGDVSPEDLPGLSGSPAILVRQETVLVPRLCGLLKQGAVFEGGTRLLYFARLDCIGTDGAIHP